MATEIQVALIMTLSAFTLAFSGFGFSLVAVPLLALVLPIKAAVAFQMPYALILVAWQAWKYRAHVSLRELWPITCGALAAMPLGAWMLFAASEAVLKRALAAFIVLSIVGLALPAGRRLGRLFAGRVWWGALWGALSGWFQGAYSTGGPPAVIFIMASDPEPRRAMGFLGGFFTLLYAIMFAIHISTGLFTLQVLRDCAVYAPVVALGALAGTLLFRRASSTTYRWAVQGLLLLAALLLWIGS